jgi:hypothetical protein
MYVQSISRGNDETALFHFDSAVGGQTPRHSRTSPAEIQIVIVGGEKARAEVELHASESGEARTSDGGWAGISFREWTA